MSKLEINIKPFEIPTSVRLELPFGTSKEDVRIYMAEIPDVGLADMCRVLVAHISDAAGNPKPIDAVFNLGQPSTTRGVQVHTTFGVFRGWYERLGGWSLQTSDSESRPVDKKYVIGWSEVTYPEIPEG